MCYLSPEPLRLSHIYTCRVPRFCLPAELLVFSVPIVYEKYKVSAGLFHLGRARWCVTGDVWLVRFLGMESAEQSLQTLPAV